MKVRILDRCEFCKDEANVPDGEVKRLIVDN